MIHQQSQDYLKGNKIFVLRHRGKSTHCPKPESVFVCSLMSTNYTDLKKETWILFLYLIRINLGFPGGSGVKNPPANAGESGLIPGWGRPPGGGNGNPLQYSCLKNLVNRGAWWVIDQRVGKESDMPEPLSKRKHVQMLDSSE